METHSLQVLEFASIVEQLTSLCAVAAGRERAASIAPVAGDELAARRTRTAEAMRLLALAPGLAIEACDDPRGAVELAALDGELGAEELQRIGRFLAVVADVRAAVRRHGDQVRFLAAIADGLPQLKDLARELERSFDLRGDVADGASDELAAARRDLRGAHGQLTSRLDEFITSTRVRPALQDSIVTLRDGRYVVPVKAEFRSTVRGVVHDTSATGQTLFIEPFSVVDLNNRWRELQAAERREIDRVLRRLSRLVANNAAPLRLAVDGLAELDWCLARARLASAMQATLPAVVSGSETAGEAWRLRLKAARHPLLRGVSVPLDIEAGGRFPCVVITGPNTGGKTVALKTAGLLTLMALSGLAIPAAAESSVPAFDAVFADIGDEQSIAQSLSTFGAHMTTIVRTLAGATPQSLVLLDELGAGTDPAEGSALARAILEWLTQRQVLTIATTHHSEIKAFAYETPGVRNASMEFDPVTLAPTYRLVLDVPGRSNAFEIAERLGLDPAIVQRGRSLRPETGASIDALVADLQRLRADAEAERQRASRAATAADRARTMAEAEQAQLDATKTQQLEEATESLARYRREIEARLKRVARRVSKLEDRTDAGAAQEELERVAAATPPRRARVPLRRTGERLQPVAPLRVGDSAIVAGLGATGRIVAIQDAVAEVQIGTMKARVPLHDLRRSDTPPVELAPAPLATRGRPELNRDVATQIDLRGVRAWEIAPRLEEYLDDAALAGLGSIRIIHGKGSGALREAVREALLRNRLVGSFELGAPEDGGEGVTLAVLADA